MKPWHELMIRQCKSNDPSERKMRRIYAASRALPLEYCDLSYVNYGLMEIIKEYDLVKDWYTFMIDVERRRDGRYYFDEECSFNEALFRQCVSTIALTSVSQLPEYRRPARFRNRKLVRIL